MMHSPWFGVKPAVRASMQANKSKNTNPEKRLDSLLRLAKYKFASNVVTLPGKPDFVFPRRKCAIFLHGCFWHQHTNCKRSHRPASRTEYWDAKLARNRKNDIRARRKLRALGWRVLVIWECQIKDTQRNLRRIREFLLAPDQAGRLGSTSGRRHGNK